VGREDAADCASRGFLPFPHCCLTDPELLAIRCSHRLSLALSVSEAPRLSFPLTFPEYSGGARKKVCQCMLEASPLG